MPASITCRFPSRTATKHPPTTSPAIRAPSRASARLPPKSSRLGLPLTVNTVVHRANIGRIDAMVDLALVAGRQPRRDRACAVLRLGAEEPRRTDADARAGRAGGAAGRDAARQAPRPDRHRRGGAGLLCALSQALRRRLGPPVAQRHARRQGAALPRGRSHSRARILECARAFARRDLADFAGI